MNIRRLPKEVAGLISAGEVVARPLSVVKELMENSLDAGATTIEVQLINGGKTMISVKDNGIGIPSDQLPLAVEKHATSKIYTVEDLEHIVSLGYRGEALASMVAVSRFDLYSRAKGAKTGARLTVLDGQATVYPIDMEEGTQIRVSDLFYNLPARSKFLKSPVAEAKRVAELVRDYSVAWPSVAFTLQSEGKTIFSSPGKGDRLAALVNLWGDEPTPQKRIGNGACGSAEIWWQDTGPATRLKITIFINGRRVEERSLRAALLAHPWGNRGNWFISLDLPTEDLDVNVHPAKTEVLLRRGQEVFSLVRDLSALFASTNTELTNRQWSGTQAFARERGAAEGYSSRVLTFDSPLPKIPSVGSEKLRAAPWETVSAQSFREQYSPKEPLPTFVEGRAFEAPSTVTYHGQMPQGYLLFSDEEGLMIVDPHAAHERINYEKLVNHWQGSVPISQLLAVPFVPSPSLASELEGNEELLRKLGFNFDNGEVTAVPTTPFDLEPSQLLRGALAALDGGKQEELLDRFATKACKASVKLTNRLADNEALQLLIDLRRCEEPNSCPHGRPALLRLITKKLDDHFGRNGL